MASSLPAIPFDIRRNAQSARPVVVEVVSQEDGQSDMIAAGDIHAGLGSEFDVHLVHLGDLENRLTRRAGVFSIAKDGPNFEDALVEILRSVKADILHTHRFADLASVGNAARRAGVNHLVHTITDTTEMSATWDLSSISAILDIHKPLLVAVSGALPDDFDLRNRAIACVPQGIDSGRYGPGDTNRARRRIGLPQDTKIIGCASPVEHLEPFLRAMMEIGDDVHVALFGDAKPDAGQRRWLQQLDMEERVHVLGPWADPGHIYQAMDVYFHGPSTVPYPRPVLAAQATGIPVVATAPTCVNTIGPTGGQVLGTPSVPVLAAALREALSASPKPAARQFVESNWNAKLTVDAYQDIFTSLSERVSQAS